MRGNGTILTTVYTSVVASLEWWLHDDTGIQRCHIMLEESDLATAPWCGRSSNSLCLIFSFSNMKQSSLGSKLSTKTSPYHKHECLRLMLLHTDLSSFSLALKLARCCVSHWHNPLTHTQSAGFTELDCRTILAVLYHIGKH